MTNSKGPIERIIIVGGGTSGWITAAMLTKILQGRCTVTVLESPAIGRIGVGEASVPSIKEEVFDFLGIPEETWMPACQGTYKLGIKFVDWVFDQAGRSRDFYHLFGEVDDVDRIPLTHYWLKKRLQGFEGNLDHTVYAAKALCDANRSPRYLDGRHAENYAYHFDAALVAEFLTGWAIDHGVQRIEATITDVQQDERGWVSGLVTDDGETHSADLYIDCSGFRGLLINQTLDEPFISVKNNLFCDRAVAMNRTNAEDEDLEPYSTATALSSGWTWKIPLMTRTGNGYVYSSDFLTESEAEAEFRRHLGVGPDEGTCRHLRMRVGRNRRAWVHNVVAVGLSYSFLEPLESTGIYSAYAAVHQLMRHFPEKDMDPRLQDHFNERVAFMVDDIRDFIVMHYAITNREDSAFWRTCKEELPLSDTLKETLDLYMSGVPVKLSYSGEAIYKHFDASFDRFWTNSNYLAILVGMGKVPDRAMPLLSYKKEALAQAESRFNQIQIEGQRLVQALPSHREYLDNIARMAPTG